MSALEFVVRRTKGDYFGAVLLHAVKSPWTYFGLLFSPSFVAVITVIFGWNDPGGPMSAAMALFVVSLVAMLVLLFPCYLWAARAGWRSPGALEPISYAIDASGVRIQSAAGSGDVNWVIFSGAFENSKLFLLRQHPGLLQIIPKRDVSAPMLESLRQLVREHVKGPLKIQTRSAP